MNFLAETTLWVRWFEQGKNTGRETPPTDTGAQGASYQRTVLPWEDSANEMKKQPRQQRTQEITEEMMEQHRLARTGLE